MLKRPSRMPQTRVQTKDLYINLNNKEYRPGDSVPPCNKKIIKKLSTSGKELTYYRDRCLRHRPRDGKPNELEIYNSRRRNFNVRTPEKLKEAANLLVSLNKPTYPELVYLSRLARNGQLGEEGRRRVYELRPMLNKTLNPNTLRKITEGLSAANIQALFQTSKTTRNALKGLNKPEVRNSDGMRHRITNNNAELLVAPLMKTFPATRFQGVPLKLTNEQIDSIARKITSNKSKEGRKAMFKMIHKLTKRIPIRELYNATIPIGVLSRMSKGYVYSNLKKKLLGLKKGKSTSIHKRLP